jgi:hypothetical protein
MKNSERCDMTYTRRQLLRASLACSLLPLTACDRSVAGLPKEKITQKYPMKTYAVGRFLIDLPDAAKEVSMSQRYIGMKVKWIDASKAQFASVLKQKRLSLSGMHRNEPILLKDEAGSDEDTHFFLFKQLSPESGLLEVDAYRYAAQLNGYHFFSSQVDPQRSDEALPYARKVLSAVQSRLVTPATTERGACFDHAFVTGSNAQNGEEAAILASFDNVSMSFFTQAIDSVSGIPLMQRAERASEFPDVKILRKTKREIAGLYGGEFSFKDVPQASSSYSFNWEYDGQPNSVAAPKMRAGLETMGSTSLPQDELLGLWDAVLESIRVRPGAV